MVLFSVAFLGHWDIFAFSECVCILASRPGTMDREKSAGFIKET